MSKKIYKEKDLAPICIKTIIKTLSAMISESTNKFTHQDKFKDRKDCDGVYNFKTSDYEIFNGLYGSYEMLKKFIQHLKFVFDTPFSIFNKANNLNVDLEIMFRFLYFNLVFTPPLTVIIIINNSVY